MTFACSRVQTLDEANLSSVDQTQDRKNAGLFLGGADVTRSLEGISCSPRKLLTVPYQQEEFGTILRAYPNFELHGRHPSNTKSLDFACLGKAEAFTMDN